MRLKTRLKITQLEKASFIKVKELKLIEVELFQFVHFMCVAANASELFCMAHLANIEWLLYSSNFHFKYRILYPCQLELTKINLSARRLRFLSEMSEINSR